MARIIPDDIRDQIRTRADLVEVIQSYVPNLKKVGATWKACCPFHQEKTPSFNVNPERGFYKCFGCGKGGDVFSFIMEMERLDFPNAIEFLAQKYGIVIPDEQPHYAGKISHQEAEKEYSLRERLYKLHELLADWYRKNLLNNPESAVAKYFATRQIPQDIASQFMIGASPDSWDAAILYAKREKYTEQELRLSGLVSEKEAGSDHIYDRFRNRLMFPIWNEHGRIIAFSARSVEKDPQGWKYVNSPESPVFKKSRTLYALHFARKPIAEKGYAILCEGQLDVIAMHRAGCTCAVAPQGTAFGDEQAAILHRYTTNIRLACDNDKAGREAVFKDAKILLPKGFLLRVVVYPGAKDADELLKSQGAEVLQQTVDGAVDFFEYALNQMMPDPAKASPAEKIETVKKMLEYLTLPDDPASRDLYAGWVAEKLGLEKQSILADIERKLTEQKQVLLRQQRHAGERAAFAAAAEPSSPGVPEEVSAGSEATHSIQPRSVRYPQMHRALLEMIELLLREEDYAARAVGDITPDMLDETYEGRAVELIVQAKMNEEWEGASGGIMMMLTQDNVTKPEIQDILTANIDSVPEPGNTESEKRSRKQTVLLDKLYSDCMGILRCCAMKDRRSELIRQIQGMPEGEEKNTLLREMLELSRELSKLSKH